MRPSFYRPHFQVQKPSNRIRSLAYGITHTHWFEKFIVSVIILNTFTLMLEHYAQSATWTLLLDGFNFGFTAIFTLEAVFKLLAMGRRYFSEGWNLFDFFIVLAALLGVVLETLSANLPIDPTALRILRVVRLVRIIEHAKGIQRLLVTLILSAPAMLNVGSLLFLIVFIFSVIAMNLFGHVRGNGVLNEFTNFSTFGGAFKLLLRLITAGGWNDVLEACAIQPPNCDLTYRGLSSGDCGDPLAAKLFFSSFVLLSFIVIVNMYIAVILENLTASSFDDELPISDADVNGFYARWSQYDPHATQFAAHDHLLPLIANLPPPLGIPRAELDDIGHLDIPVFKGDRVHCVDVLHAVVRRTMAMADAEENGDTYCPAASDKFRTVSLR